MSSSFSVFRLQSSLFFVFKVEDLFLLFAKKASAFNSWFENAEEDLTDPVRCNSVEEIRVSCTAHVNRPIHDKKRLDIISNTTMSLCIFRYNCLNQSENFTRPNVLTSGCRNERGNVTKKPVTKTAGSSQF